MVVQLQTHILCNDLIFALNIYFGLERCVDLVLAYEVPISPVHVVILEICTNRFGQLKIKVCTCVKKK